MSSYALTTAVNRINRGLEEGNKQVVMSAAKDVVDNKAADTLIATKALLRAYTGLCILDPENALAHLKKAHKVDPNDAAVHNNFGYVYHKKYNAFDKSIESYEECLRLDPQFETAYLGLIDVLDTLRLNKIKYEYICRGIEKLPKSVELHNVLGLYMLHHAQQEDALTRSLGAFRKALTMNASDTGVFQKVYLNMGHLSSVSGEPSQAIRHYIRAIEHKDKDPLAYSNILLNLHYITTVNDPCVKALSSFFKVPCQSDLPTFICSLSTEFSRRLWTAPNAYRAKWGRDAQSSTFIKDVIHVGFIGADFSGHAVSCFMDAVLKGLVAHPGFKVYVYCNAVYDAGVSAQVPCDEYVCVKDIPTETVVRTMLEHDIDILIDLSGHTSGNRLDVIARHPARTVLSYCGYPNDTFIPFVRRLTDTYTEMFTKSSLPYIDLQRVFLTYTPHPVYTTLTIKSYDTYKPNGVVTVGCFAKLPKINQRVIRAWCEILRKNPQVRFVLKSKFFRDKKLKQRWLNKFNPFEKRVQLLLGTEGSDAHMSLFKVLDLHLDTFPYSGTTITTESLYMNVPVLTLSENGSSHVSRVSASILRSMGLGNELVATSVQDYIDRVGQLIPKLGTFDVREKMMQSPFMDHDAMTEAMVTALSQSVH